MKHFPFGVFGLLGAALALGIAGDLLLRDVGPFGINLTIWSCATLAVLIVLAMRAGVFRDPSSRVPLAAAFFFSAIYPWRDAEPLKALQILVIAGSVALASAAAIGRSMRLAYVWDYVLDGLNFGFSTVALPFVLLGRAQEEARAGGRALPAQTFAVLRGVLIAAPLLLVFGALLASADALFEKTITDLFDIETIVSHTFLTIFCGWAAAATWWVCLEGATRVPVRRTDPGAPFRWGVTEINVAFALVALLFAGFLAIQAQYFFGGRDQILKQVGLTYAQYARRGFFELAWVAAISLALLVNCARVMTNAGPLGRRLHKAVTAAIVVCVLLIIASALYKMRLYIDAYGLTRLRLNTSCFMVWMAAVFVWLYWTILRERTRAFAFGMLLSGYAATFTLIAINPDHLVAAVNLSRAMKGATLTADYHGDYALDTEYIGDLSADAIPVIVRRLPELDAENQTEIRRFLSSRQKHLAERPLRTWTVSLQRARAALATVDGLEQPATKP